MTALQQHPYAQLLQRVRRPGQYLGGEPGQIRGDWDAVRARICLAFPDLYEIGMSHLGYKILYSRINRESDLLAERAYAVWPDMEQAMREADVSLRSLESARPLREFDVVGFSLQYELTYTNILQLLDLGGIPLRSADRGDADPLVVAGGPVATHAEPIAPFIDAFLIGDGEEKTAELMRCWAAGKELGQTRQQRLEAIAALGGFYVPALYATKENPDTGLLSVIPTSPAAPFPVRRAIVDDLSKHPFPSDGPVATTDTVFDRVSVEVARGCTEGCRFCQAGMIYRPVRERSPKAILKVIQDSVDHGGHDEISLTSLSTADYSAIAPLVKSVVESLDTERTSLSVSSLRAYGLDETVLDDLKRQRAGGLTFAPEAGTQRMRDVVNKNVTEEQLMETAARVFSRGWQKMKLYFMIGLPTEQDDDVRGIVQTGARALQVAKRVKARGARVTVSVSSHVPKPHTPFQWCAMDSMDEILRKQALLRDETRGTGVNLRMHDPTGSWLEGVLARGDRRLADAIEGAYRHGARFDSWDEQLNVEAWRAALAESSFDPQLSLHTLPIDAALPWSHIDVGLEDGFLAREYRKALRNRLSPPCGKVAGAFVHATNLRDAAQQTRPLVCYDCGIACDLTQMRSEREEALKELHAYEPRLPVEGPTTQFDRRPLLHVDQGPRARLRFQFRKLGAVAYLGHLDLVRMFPRMFRQLGVPLFYTEGFHPKPKLNFSPALALGVSSLAEYVDVHVRGGRPDALDSLCAELTRISPDGLVFCDVVPLRPGDPALGKIIDEAGYVAALGRGWLDDRGLDEASLGRRIDARFRAGNLTITRLHKGVEKTIDVSSRLRSVSVGAGGQALEAAGLIGDLLPIRFAVDVTAGPTPRPAEVLEVLLGERDTQALFVRERLYARVDGRHTTPLALQKAPPVHANAPLLGERHGTL